jgi:beta-ribofuranosylaminobenzene 5'-phosphate synthase
LFRDRPAIPEDEIRRQITLAHHEIVPALIECDFGRFAVAMTEMSSIGFKKYEVGIQSRAVGESIRDLQHLSQCVGMSSLGPTVYAMFERSDEADNAIDALGPDLAGVSTRANNTGFTFSE